LTEGCRFSLSNLARVREKPFPAPDMFRPLSSTLKHRLSALPLLVCVLLFLFHFSVIRKYAVNIPYMDEWALFSGDNHPASIDLRWLYVQHNEHRTATTKIFVWLQYQINGWNVRTHLLIDFVIYGFLLTWLVWFARRMAPHLSTWIVFAFLIFFLSPIIWIEHLVAYPVAVHFWLIFFFVSAYFLFTERQQWASLVVGCLASILSMYSFAAGFVTSLVLLLAFWIFKGLRARHATGNKDRTREFRQLLLVTVLVGGALVGWIIGYRTPWYHPPLIFPYHLAFWRFFLNLISFSFGVDRLSVFWGVIFLLIVLAPICGEVWKRRGNLSSMQWAAFAIVFAILADLAAISIGRASFGTFWSRSPEYAEHGMPLIILSAINWSIFFRDRKILRACSIAALWIFCLVAFTDNWDFDIYRYHSGLRLEGARCVRAYYQGIGDGGCPSILPGPSNPQLPLFDQAKRLNASFSRDSTKANRSSGQTVYLGAHDAADCHHIMGWAYDKSDPDAIVVVSIYDGDSLLRTIPAIGFRPDLVNAGIGTGAYSFEYETPPALKDGRPHSIRVQFAGTTLALPNSPKVLTCSKP